MYRCTTYCHFSTCGPRTSPQKPVWPFAVKCLEPHVLNFVNFVRFFGVYKFLFFALANFCFVQPL